MMNGTREDVATSAASALRAEADKIDLNAAHYGGTLVIVAPDGELVTHTFLNNEEDAAFFWSQMLTIVQATMNRVEDRQRAGGYLR